MRWLYLCIRLRALANAHRPINNGNNTNVRNWYKVQHVFCGLGILICGLPTLICGLTGVICGDFRSSRTDLRYLALFWLWFAVFCGLGIVICGTPTSTCGLPGVICGLPGLICGVWLCSDHGCAQGSFVEAEAEVEAERSRQRRGRLNSRQGRGEATLEKSSFP